MNKMRLSSAVLLGILVSALCTGCSLKEDRRDCPCVLTLDFSGVDRDMSDSLSLGVLSADGFLHRDVVRNTSYGVPYTVNVPKEELWINVYSIEPGGDSVLETVSEDMSSMTIPYGMECPQVSFFSMHANFDRETATVPVVLHKNYCRLAITMMYDGPLPLQISILGDVCGYDTEGEPTEGNFLFEPTGSRGLFYARIPRQTDSSLKLDISDEEEILREFAIGEYITESGYDWEAEDLEDVEIQINYTKTLVTIVVNDWSKSLDLETVI